MRFEAAGGEEVVCAFVGGEDFGPSLVLHRLDMYEVTVVLVDDEHVAVAHRRRLNEAAGEVGEDLAGGGGEVGVEVVGACCGWRWVGGVRVGVVGVGREGGWCGAVGGGLGKMVGELDVVALG